MRLVSVRLPRIFAMSAYIGFVVRASGMEIIQN
jgi:hypothetical protein